MLQKDERGFTLVELVISMAIFMVVAGAIMLFMLSGSKSYRYSKAELDLQMESQILINQIRDMAMKSNYASYDASTHVLTLYEIEQTPSASASPSVTPLPSASPGASLVKQVRKKRVIYWDDTSDCLYLEEYDDDSAPTCSVTEDKLFSRYMQGFEATVNKNDVQLKLDMENATSSYQITEGITIRNGWVVYP